MVLWDFRGGEEPLRRENPMQNGPGDELLEGRPVAPATDSTRKRLLQQLDRWILVEERPSLSELLTYLPLAAAGSTLRPSRCAWIDDPLVTDLLTNVFGNVPAEQPVWPLSPSGFRNRFRALRKSLAMPDNFTPVSLRGSGATLHHETTENTDLVARRGRWVGQKTTNIYLQEVQVAPVLPQLDVSEKHRILSLHEKGFSITRYAIEILQNVIDNTVWPSLFARPPTHRLPKRTAPAPSRDSLVGFRDHGTAFSAATSAFSPFRRPDSSSRECGQQQRRRRLGVDRQCSAVE